ncbi:MAG: ArsR/SmtB family transcription factor [Dethiobacteria bacterium]|nr:metalloregulator ArsR/SmtB family transcription factor [Bacillota bacterium]
MKQLISAFRALGEETRFKIILMLLEEEMCICELMEELKLSQSAVSHHVKILRQAGLANDRRDGKWTFFSINKKGFSLLENGFDELLLKPVNKYQYKEKAEPSIACPK